MKTTASILALAAWAVGLAACITATAPPQPLPDPTAGAAATAPAIPPPVETLPSIPGNQGTTPPDPTHRVCHLLAAKKSDDSCKADADCAPSDPCHARACVAKARAKPRTPEIMCTMIMGCETADANRCGCFEGRCSLIPPDDAAKE